MEAALFFLDCLLLAVLCWVVTRAEGPKGTGRLGFFDYEERHVIEAAKARAKALAKAGHKAKG
jgi:hypothetical protein